MSFGIISKYKTRFHLKIHYSQCIVSICDKYSYFQLFPANQNQQNQDNSVAPARRNC